MTDAGFFRGTSADQDNRFANKQKKLLKELNVSPILNTKLNMSKINIEPLKPWIEAKIKEVLEKEDEILSESIYEHLAEKEPDAKNILMIIMGFAEEGKASKFVEELWTKLIEVQENSNGVGSDSIDAMKANDDGDNIKAPTKRVDNDGKPIDGDSTSSNNNNNADDDKRRHLSNQRESRSRSRSGSPRTPAERDGPRRKTQESGQAGDSGSKTPTPTRKPSKSPSHSGSRRSGSELRRRSRSGSRSDSSRSRSKSSSSSRSRSKSYSRSRSVSRSRSRSHSPRFRRRSPYGGHRGRGSYSRSPSRGYRPRSRSPYRRGGFRGGFRGSYGFRDRLGRPRMAPYRGQRQSPPWAAQQRRHYSPRSPPRRRGRSPSYSPRRRQSRSPPPYRRRSRSRSPPGHMVDSRNLRRPYQRPYGHMTMGDRPLPPHRDIPWQSGPSPRVGMVDHRGPYGDVPALPPRHRSPGPSGAMAHMPYIAPEMGVMPPKPSGSGMHSPSPSRKKHKKERKHKKHKKHSSKKHSRDRSRSRSETPDRKRKKHKKHKKSKKHKS